MSEVTSPSEGRQPVLVMVVGRQRVGKTSFLNTTVQFLRAHGGKVTVWNADMLNRTYSLSMFSEDVLEPTSADAEDVKAWLEERFSDLIEHGYDAVLDIGGGDTPLARLVEEVPIVRTLERRGIRVVLVHVLGPEMADLDYLERFMSENLLAPQATLIVLNDGLVITGRSANFAFGKVRQHPALIDAALNGAKVVLMPKLACMSQVTDRHLSFADAMNNAGKPGTEPLSFFDQERVALWWERDLPPFFGSIPALWLPAMPRFSSQQSSVAEGKAPASDRKKRGAANG
jgi:hypothetical protein